MACGQVVLHAPERQVMSAESRVAVTIDLTVDDDDGNLTVRRTARQSGLTEYKTVTSKTTDTGH